jgi:hypothetical protein
MKKDNCATAVVIQPQEIREVLSDNEMSTLYSILDKLLIAGIQLQLAYSDIKADDVSS